MVVHAWICFVTQFTVDVVLIRVAHPSITIPITQAMPAIYMSARVLNTVINIKEEKKEEEEETNTVSREGVSVAFCGGIVWTYY